MSINDSLIQLIEDIGMAKEASERNSMSDNEYEASELCRDALEKLRAKIDIESSHLRVVVRSVKHFRKQTAESEAQK